LEDLELMAKNCELYNGTQHFYSKDARQIYNETLDLINVDREILGRDKDPYAIQQNDIRAKSAPLAPLSLPPPPSPFLCLRFHQLKRPLHSTITIPNLMMMSSSNQNSSTIPTSTFDGFGDFLDSGKNDVEVAAGGADLDDGLGDFDMNFDETEAFPLAKNSQEESKETRSMPLTPQTLPTAGGGAGGGDDDLGSSSGEEEVLEIGTF
jgi:hypothetical protein